MWNMSCIVQNNFRRLDIAVYSLDRIQNTYIACRNVLCHSYLWTFHIFSTYCQKLLLLGFGNQLKVSILVPIPAPKTTTDKYSKTTTTILLLLLLLKHLKSSSVLSKLCQLEEYVCFRQ